MIALPIISIIFCFAYIIYILFKYGVPVSISETYYLLPSKWDWLFSAWCVLTAIPFGIWWFTITDIQWIPIVVILAMSMIGVSCRYKSGPKDSSEAHEVPIVINESNKFKKIIKELIEKFKPKNFLKYGWAKPIHYISSLLVISLTSVWLAKEAPISIISMILSYVMFIIIGARIPAVYNKQYSLDVDNTAWIFFMEVVCFLQLFIFVWSYIFE